MLDRYLANNISKVLCKVKSYPVKFAKSTVSYSGLLCIVSLLVTTLSVSLSSQASDTTPSSKPHKSGYDNEEGFAGPGSISKRT